MLAGHHESGVQRDVDHGAVGLSDMGLVAAVLLFDEQHGGIRVLPWTAAVTLSAFSPVTGVPWGRP